MENFNLALLSAPVAMKDMSSDIQALPQKSSEKEFSGILAREESRSVDVKDDATVDQKESRKPPVEREVGENQKADCGAGDRPIKNESSDKAAEDRDDDAQETGTNVFAAVPVEDVADEDSAKIKLSAESADNLGISALLAEMPEEGVLPTAQIETSELSVLESEESMLSETLTAQANLLTQDSGGNGNDEELLLSNLFVDNELGEDSGELRLQGGSPEEEFGTKLFSADIAAKSAADSIAETAAEKLPVSGSQVEPAAAESEKKKIELVENAKVFTFAQNTVSDISEAAVAVDPVIAQSETDSSHQARMVDRLSAQGGISLDELPGEVEISVESEIIVSDEKLQRKVNFSNRLADSQSLSGKETGTVHLQGRARENQPSLMQNDQGQKDSTAFTDGENNRGKAVFMDELKQSVSEKITSESVLQSGTKDKPLQETNFSKSELLADVNSDLSNASAVKKSVGSMFSKPLPISDDHLLDQIQAGLTRQVNGRQTVTIKLWPEHLGRVDVKLVMHKQHLTATFMVDHPEVKDAMMRKLDTLRDSLGLRGIDAKDISIKVTPAKSGDGPSLMTDNQQQNGNSAWRQFNQGSLANGNSQSQHGWSEDGGNGSIPDEADIPPEIAPYADSVIDPGSLHITA